MKRINETIHDVFIDVNTNEMFFTWRGEQYTGKIIHVWGETVESLTPLEDDEIPESYLYRVAANDTMYDILQLGTGYKIAWDHEREL